MSVVFHTVRRFVSDPKEADLNRRLVQFEENVENALAEVEAVSQPLPKLSADAATVVTGTVQAAWDTTLRVDTSSAAIEVQLPGPSATKDGHSVRIIKTNSGGSALTVRPISGNVQGAATHAPTAIGAHTYVTDGTDWWLA